MLEYGRWADDIPAEQATTEFHWSEVAQLLVDDHAAKIAQAIFRTQVRPETWFTDHHGARYVLRDCVKKDPQGVSRELATFLDGENAQRLVVGFPNGLIDELPSQDLLTWAAQDQGRRHGYSRGSPPQPTKTTARSSLRQQLAHR
jgi:hypothetical protein